MVVRKRLFVQLLLSAVLSPAGGAVPPSERPAHYVAALADGQRVEGDKVYGWYEHPGSPRLDKSPLLAPNRRLRWLSDRTLVPWKAPERCGGYIEFVGGDRLVGRVVGGWAGGRIAGLYVPAHLLVKPATPLHHPAWESLEEVRILPGRMERVVFGPPSRRPLQPGTLYYLDGRQQGFLRARWQEESVVLLLQDRTCEVKLSKIAEVHLPQVDPWQAYYEELAVLSPACRSRMLRLETTGGLIATGSWLRFRASVCGRPGKQQGIVQQIKRLGGQVAQMEAERKANQLKLEQAGANYRRQLAASEKQEKADQQAYHKAAGEMRQRTDGLRKADAERWKKQRQQLEQELSAADKAMREQLAKLPLEKHDSALKAFGEKQEQLRKSREKSLEDERLKLDRQRQEELDRFIKAQAQRLKQRAKELLSQLADLKRRVDEEAGRWEAFLRRLESVKSQRVSLLDGHREIWYHILQPVWSLDALWVPFRSIHTRWSFSPEQVPLCRVRPVATVSPPLLPWHKNRNSAGRPLRSGGRQYAWGFAVHAYSELRFPLPRCASAFRSRIGLDRLVGSGGCVRARVYVGSTTGKPVYEGPLLVGSKKTADTGRVRLHLPAEGPRHFILQADPAYRDSPAGADPLNIRDELDWLDPWLELDTAKLQDEVRRRVGPMIAESQGWTLGLDRRGVYTWTSHLDEIEGPGAGCFRTMLRAQGHPVRLSRTMTVRPTDKWLAVSVGLPTAPDPRPDAVALHVGQARIQPRKIPIRQRWQDRPAPIVFPLEKYQGRKITLELTQPAGGKPLHWQTVNILAAPPPAYRLVDIMELFGKGDMHVPYELGQALQSDRLGDQEKLAALEISRLGGIVNFRTEQRLDRLANVLVGRAWMGGDKTFIKTFITFRKMTSLESLLVTRDSGISDGAIAKLQAQMPKLTIHRFIKRIPSAGRGHGCAMTWRNLTRKEVTIIWVDSQGKLIFSSTPRLKPGEELKRNGNTGIRYEAHYLRKDYVNAKDYIFSQPLSNLRVVPDTLWEIKLGGR